MHVYMWVRVRAWYLSICASVSIYMCLPMSWYVYVRTSESERADYFCERAGYFV